MYRYVPALHDHHVMLEGMILKPNMVTAGKSAAPQASAGVGLVLLT